jgi:hypothetical protein
MRRHQQPKLVLQSVNLAMPMGAFADRATLLFRVGPSKG